MLCLSGKCICFLWLRIFWELISKTLAILFRSLLFLWLSELLPFVHHEYVNLWNVDVLSLNSRYLLFYLVFDICCLMLSTVWNLFCQCFKWSLNLLGPGQDAAECFQWKLITDKSFWHSSRIKLITLDTWKSTLTVRFLRNLLHPCPVQLVRKCNNPKAAFGC